MLLKCQTLLEASRKRPTSTPARLRRELSHACPTLGSDGKLRGTILLTDQAITVTMAKSTPRRTAEAFCCFQWRTPNSICVSRAKPNSASSREAMTASEQRLYDVSYRPKAPLDHRAIDRLIKPTQGSPRRTLNGVNALEAMLVDRPSRSRTNVIAWLRCHLWSSPRTQPSAATGDGHILADSPEFTTLSALLGLCLRVFARVWIFAKA